MSPTSDTTCPFCGAAFAPGSTACPACDLPLLVNGRAPDPTGRAVFDGEGMLDLDHSDEFDMPEIDPAGGFRHESLRRRPRVGMLTMHQVPVKPEYTQGELRCVVVALNQAEAEMLEDMLRSEGIPCMIRRFGRAELPEFFATGRREILVPERALDAARELLRIEAPLAQAPMTSPGTLALSLLAGIAFVVLCVGLIVGLT